MEPNSAPILTAEDLLTLSVDARTALFDSGIVSGQEAQHLLMTLLPYGASQLYDNIIMLECIRDLIEYVEQKESDLSSRIKDLKAVQIDPLEREAKALGACGAAARQAIRDQFLITGTKAAAGFLLVEATTPTYILPEPSSQSYLALCRVLNTRAPHLLQVRVKVEDLRKYLQREGDEWVKAYGVEAELKAHIRLV